MQRLPHIIHVIDGLGTGGAERIVYELATRTNPADFEVEVVGLVPRVGDSTKHALEEFGVPVRWIEKHDKLGIELYEDLLHYFQRVQPDIVHTHLFAADVWGGRAAARAHVRGLVSTEHSVNRNEGWLKHLAKCLVNRRRQRIVAISETVAAYVNTYCPASATKVQVIANGIDMQRFLAPPRAATEGPVELVTVGRLAPEKGQVELLRALAFVRRPFHLTVVGDGPQRKALEGQVERLGWQDKVTFVGRRDDVERYFQAAEVALVPSRWEGLGLAAIEAMAAGCAVVASDVDGLREVVSDGDTGLLVDFQTAQRAGEEIEALLQDSGRRERLALAGQEAVREVYTVDKMVEEYAEMYRSIL